MGLGKLEKVDILRDVWSRGAKAFNPRIDEVDIIV